MKKNTRNDWACVAAAGTLAEAVLSGFQIGEDGELIEDEDEQAAIRKAHTMSMRARAFAIFRPL